MGVQPPGPSPAPHCCSLGEAKAEPTSLLALGFFNVPKMCHLRSRRLRQPENHLSVRLLWSLPTGGSAFKMPCSPLLSEN